MSKKKVISVDSQIEGLVQRNRDPKVQAERLSESVKGYLRMLTRLRELEEQKEDISQEIENLCSRIDGYATDNPNLFKCPSCGETMEIESDEHDRFYFSCEHCYLTTPSRESEEEAYRCLLMFREMFEREGAKNE